jgi:hypothetical protein
VLSCEDNTSDNDEFRYPLDVGNKWTYSYNNKIYFGFSIDSLVLENEITCIAHTEINSIVSINNEEYYAFVVVDTCNWDSSSYFLPEDSTNRSIKYLQQNDDGLFEVGYDGIIGNVHATPKLVNNEYLNYPHMEIFQNLKSMNDSVLFYTYTQQSLKYPLIIGQSWNVIDSDSVLSKTVISSESYSYRDINTFGYRIDLNYFNDIDGFNIYEIIGEKGLLYRYGNGGNQYRMSEAGEVINIFHFIFELKLIDTNF